MSKKITVEVEFPVVIDDRGEQFGEERWMGRCPSLAGCIVSGATEQEAISELRTSIEITIAYDYSLRP